MTADMRETQGAGFDGALRLRSTFSSASDSAKPWKRVCEFLAWWGCSQQTSDWHNVPVVVIPVTRSAGFIQRLRDSNHFAFTICANTSTAPSGIQTVRMQNNMLTSVRALKLPLPEQVQVLVSELLDFSGSVCLCRASRCGWLHWFKRTRPTGMCACHVHYGAKVMDEAAANGHLEVVKWLHTNCSEGCTTIAMDGAAKNGHLAVVEWLHANRDEGCTTRAMDGAATNDHLAVVEWLHVNRSEGCTTEAMDGAAMRGYLSVVEWLHANRNEGCTTDAMDWAARCGHLVVVQWLHANRGEGCTTSAMDGAAYNGHLAVVEWLYQNRSESCTTSAMDWAANEGHHAVVEWLHRNHSESCTLEAIRMAVLKVHLAIVEWLGANDL